MSYKPRDVYRGRRKFKVPLTIFLFVVAGVLVLAVVLFYGLQQYLVYDQNGVTLQLPFSGQSKTEEQAVATAQQTAASDDVQVDVVYENPDFSDIDLTVGENLSSIKGFFVDYQDVVNSTALASKASIAQSQGCNSIILEMKPQSGQLAWNSTTDTAVGYGTAGTVDFTDTVASLHQQGFSVAAQISCCADTLLATRNWTIALQDSSGAPYADSSGVHWLDPYNHAVRDYLIGLMKELVSMGFDEIILSDLCHPINDSGFKYTVSLQTDPSPVTAICQLGRKLAEAMDSSDVTLSVLISESSLQNDLSASTGQDLSIFWRLFDRLYCSADTDNASSDLEKASSFLSDGSAANRFVPVCTHAPSGFDSWVLEIPSD